MIHMLAIKQRVKLNMINVLSALIGKVDNIQEHMGNVSREMRTLRKNSKNMAEIKNGIRE